LLAPAVQKVRAVASRLQDHRPLAALGDRLNEFADGSGRVRNAVVALVVEAASSPDGGTLNLETLCEELEDQGAEAHALLAEIDSLMDGHLGKHQRDLLQDASRALMQVLPAVQKVATALGPRCSPSD
jgi:hypothetical protein